jgi:hypothetical protein
MRAVLMMILIVLGLMIGCRQDKVEPPDTLIPHQGPIKITGAYALTPLITLWVDEFQKARPEIRFTIEPNGSNRGLRDKGLFPDPCESVRLLLLAKPLFKLSGHFLRGVLENKPC